jgi:prepilin-type N-terminal cleavage/methylation domain-containing protein
MRRGGFTLVELVFVIVVFGIVATIGSKILFNMYEHYIRTQIVNELQAKTQIALDQIAKRLEYRIKATAVSKELNSSGSVVRTKMLALEDSVNEYHMLEWIGYDNESFRGEWDGAKFTPGWSGFIDLNSPATDKSQVKSEGSRFDLAENCIHDLSYGEVSFSNPSSDMPAILFKKFYYGASYKTFGLDPTSNDHNDTYRVNNTGMDLLNFVEGNVSYINEQYYLAWSAYAIAPDMSDSSDNFKLYLYYNYQPWSGEKFSDGKKALIAENVSTFKFNQVGDVVQIKLCIQDGNITGEPVAFCKERTIY